MRVCVYIYIYIYYTINLDEGRGLLNLSYSSFRQPSLYMVGNFASQDFDICLRNVCVSFDKYCGDLRKRRIREKTAQESIKLLAREIPWYVVLISPIAVGLGSAAWRNSSAQPLTTTGSKARPRGPNNSPNLGEKGGRPSSRVGVHM